MLSKTTCANKFHFLIKKERKDLFSLVNIVINMILKVKAGYNNKIVYKN